MRFKALIIGLLLGARSAQANEVQAFITPRLAGLEVKASNAPYSRTIERIFIGCDKQGNPRIGIAHREIETFKTITAVVVVHKTSDGFILHEAVFPDVGIIRDAKDRKQVLDVLKSFKGVAFDPHAEKSAVDGVTGATRYGIKTYGYLNYMARKVALEMGANPDWPTRKAE